MSVVVSDLKARFGLDDKNFQSGMKRVDKQLGNTKMDIFSLEKAWKLAWAGISAAVVAGASKIAKESVMLASDMRELDNVFNVFLEGSAKKFEKKADDLAEKLGRSDYAMRKLTSQGLALSKSTGAVGDAVGETALQISGLAVDLASLYNTSDDEAFVALASALRGEQEPLRRYNVLLSEAALNQYAMSKGLNESTRNMSEQEKASLRLQYILENTTEAQGDAVRTQKEFANQLKVLKSNLEDIGLAIGNNLIDPLGKALIALNDFLDASKKEVKIEIDDSALERLSKFTMITSKGIPKKISEDVGNVSDIFSGIIKGLGIGVGKTFNTLGRPFIDASNQSKASQIKTEDIKEQADIYGLASKIEENRKNYFDKIKENNTKQNELTKNSIEALNKNFSNIEEIGKRTNMTSLDVQKDKLDELDSIISKAVGSDKYTDIFLSYVTAQRKIIAEQITNAELEAERIEKEKELSADSLNLEFKKIEELGKIKGTDITEILSEKLNIIDSKLLEAYDYNVPQSITDYLEFSRRNISDELELISERKQNQIDEAETLKKREEHEKAWNKIVSESGYETYKASKEIEELTRKNKEFGFSSAKSKEQVMELLKAYSKIEGIDFEKLSKEADKANKEIEKASKEGFELFSKNAKEVAQITSELSELFGDDFLGALTNTLNSASSLAMNISQGNYFGAVASGISLANDIKDYLSADSDIEDKRQKANDKFEEAVNKFEKTIDDMNIGEAIKYAQLTPPSQLASASVTGAKGPVDFEWYDALLGAGMPKAWYKILGGGKPESAKLDTSAIQEQLNKAGYGDIDVASIFGNYAQYSEYRDWSDWGKKKSYISGYDIAGATEEINKIIEDMYQKNLASFKTSVGLTAENFKNVMIKTFTTGGEISQNLNEMMRDAAIKGFFSQEAFTKLNEMLGDKFSEALFKDLNMEDFNITSDMSLEDAMSTFANAYEIGSEQLTELFDKLGISVDNTTESMNRLSSSSTNLPSGVKTALASYQATNVTSGDTNIIIQGDMFGDNIQKKIIQGINAAKGTATGNYMPLY